MGIIGDKLQQKINDNNNTRYSDTIAEITYYDNIRNTASIRFANPNNGSVMTANNIAVRINTGGLSQAALEIGQKCWISFIGNNLLCPVVTNLCDDRYYDNIYSKKTNADQGAYLVNNGINNIDIDSIRISPMTNDYFNDAVSTKYSLITKDYTDTEAIQVVRKSLMEIDKYKSSEDGITNIKSNSTVKFKDNGDIDIFVSNNVGIRISNEQHKVFVYGVSLEINGIEINEDLLTQVKNSNNLAVNDIMTINKLANNINFIDDLVKEIQEILDLLVDITGDLAEYNVIRNKIREYQVIKNTYLDTEDLTIEEIKKINADINILKAFFESELNDAQDIL